MAEMVRCDECNGNVTGERVLCSGCHVGLMSIECDSVTESLRLALATATRERDEAQNTAAFLLELLRAAVRTGTKDPFLDARLTEELRSHE